MQNRYEKISGRRTPTRSQQQWGEVVEDDGVEGEKVTLYLLGHRFLSRNGQGKCGCVWMCVDVCVCVGGVHR